MKRSDIKIDGVYLVKYGYHQAVKARVLATGLPYRRRYGAHATRDRQDGIRIELLEAGQRDGYGEELPTGTVLTEVSGDAFTSRHIMRPWTEADDADREAAAVEEARKRAIEDRLGAAGYAYDRYHGRSEPLDGDYRWHGQWLSLSPKLTVELLDQADL